jgi:hypothetical protein
MITLITGINSNPTKDYFDSYKEKEFKYDPDTHSYPRSYLYVEKNNSLKYQKDKNNLLWLYPESYNKSEKEQIKSINKLLESGKNLTILTHLEIIYLCFCVAIVENKLKSEEFIIHFVFNKNKTLLLNTGKDGRLKELRPKGFFDESEKLLNRILFNV